MSAQPFLEIALARVRAERTRQEQLVAAGRLPWNCTDPEVSNDEKLAVLSEELGEVARALLCLHTPDAVDVEFRLLRLRDELVQTAAVAVAWVEAIERRIGGAW